MLQIVSLSPAELAATEADRSLELAFALSDAGIVKGELLSVPNCPHCIQGNGEAAPTCHDLGLAVGVAAMADAARKVALQPKVV